MSERPERAHRVLLCNLAPMERLGMARMLRDVGVHVETEDGAGPEIVARARGVHADTVVLSMEDTGARDLAREVHHELPAAKVILWARDESGMEVYDRRAASRRVAPGVLDALLLEMTMTDPAGQGA